VNAALFEVLFSWALTLSGYPAAEMPRVEFMPRAFFVQNACGGSPNCKVVGWYRGGGVVYVWDRLDVDGDQVAASIVVHEFTHYLQGQAGRSHTTCSDVIDLEREAYGVQKEYLLRNGVLANGVGLTTVSMHCEKDH
jgi:hypothetical protein